MSGTFIRAPTIRSGCSVCMTPMAYAPRTSLSAARTASTRSPVYFVSMRWASTSVSVSDVNRWPSATSRSLISA